MPARTLMSPSMTRATASAALLLTSLLAATSTAQAQGAAVAPITISLIDSDAAIDTSDATFNLAACRAEQAGSLTVKVSLAKSTFPLSANLRFSLKVARTGASCDTAGLNTTGEGCSLAIDSAAIPSAVDASDSSRYFQQALVDFNDLFPDITSADNCENLDSVSANLTVVAESIDEATGTKKEIPLSDSFALVLSTIRPPQPDVALSIEAGESTFQASFQAASTLNYKLYFGTQAVPPGTQPETLGASFRSASVTPGSNTISSDILRAGQTFYVALVAVDSINNESLTGTTATFTGVSTLDFFELYKESGGTDPGGFCATTGHAPARPGHALLGALLLGALIGLRRARRPATHHRRGNIAALIALAAAAFALSAPSQAQAQARTQEREPTSGMFELRLGSYTPQIDDAFDNQTPYNAAFGGGAMFLTEIEIDNQFYNGFGTAAIGLTLGLMEKTGEAKVNAGTGDNGAIIFNDSADKTELSLFTARLSLIYRFDVLAVDLDIPLVPVFKVGLDHYIFWITNSQGETADFRDDQGNDSSGLGGTFGYHTAFALHLLLDWFDQTSADTLQADFGLLNTYIFAEFALNTIDDFGSDESFDFSDTNGNFMFGIAFEY